MITFFAGWISDDQYIRYFYMDNHQNLECTTKAPCWIIIQTTVIMGSEDKIVNYYGRIRDVATVSDITI